MIMVLKSIYHVFKICALVKLDDGIFYVNEPVLILFFDVLQGCLLEFVFFGLSSLNDIEKCFKNCHT